jgi:hypothetical protein
MKTGTLISREIFTSSGSTVVPVGASKCTALVVNGGNGGNGGDQAGSNRPGYGDTYGGGGGYGAYPVLKSFSNLTIGASITATVGAGGGGGAGGSGATGDEFSPGVGSIAGGIAGGVSSVSGAIALTGSTDYCYPSGSSSGQADRVGAGGGGWNFSIDANYDIHFQRPYFGSKSVYGSNNGGDGGAYSSSGSLGGDGGTTACSSGGAGATGGFNGATSGGNGGNGASFGAGGGGGAGANHDEYAGIGDGLTGGNGGNGSAGIVILWFYS